MTKFMSSHRGKSFVRSTAVVALVAGAGYVAGAVIHGTFTIRDASAAFAQPLRPAFASQQGIQFEDDGVPDTFDWVRSGINQHIEAPRECDATLAITMECVFMD